MNLLFPGARVQGILGVVPSTELDFLEDMRRFDFPEAKSLKLKMVMGYDKHRVAHPSTCVSDLAVHGFQHPPDNGRLGAVRQVGIAPEGHIGCALVLVPGALPGLLRGSHNRQQKQYGQRGREQFFHGVSSFVAGWMRSVDARSARAARPRQQAAMVR